ncbi:MAG: VWA domain-containing protein [Chloracidobacterium sp.]|nr:VWA domain-containing protein [Chloracidobacterium sp.]
MKFFSGLIFLVLVLSLNVPNFYAQTDDDAISVESSIVVLNASITDSSGKAVGGLTQKLFHIFEDGVEQKIETFDTQETPFAAVILLDTSGSMENRVSLARAAAINFLERLRVTDNATIYNFSSKVELVQDFSNSRDIRYQAFDLKADGMTALNDAVYKAAEVLSKRLEKRRAIIVLSDGADTMSKVSESKSLKAALSVNAMIFAVDMSSPDLKPNERTQNRGTLTNFAEKTGGRYISTPGGIAMRDAFTRIVEELGTQYTLTYQPSNIKKDGKWHAIELRVSKPNLAIRTRKGYNAQKK